MSFQKVRAAEVALTAIVGEEAMQAVMVLVEAMIEDAAEDERLREAASRDY